MVLLPDVLLPEFINSLLNHCYAFLWQKPFTNLGKRITKEFILFIKGNANAAYTSYQ